MLYGRLGLLLLLWSSRNRDCVCACEPRTLMSSLIHRGPPPPSSPPQLLWEAEPGAGLRLTATPPLWPLHRGEGPAWAWRCSAWVSPSQQIKPDISILPEPYCLLNKQAHVISMNRESPLRLSSFHFKLSCSRCVWCNRETKWSVLECVRLSPLP